MSNYANQSIGYDATFELNEFGETKIKSEIETLKDVLFHILMSKPGHYPSLPLLGMDIGSRLYSFFDEIDVENIKQELANQCSLLGIYIEDNTIQILKTEYKGQPTLLINVSGTAIYPNGYKVDHKGTINEYLIGITYDKLNNLIYNINQKG